jgi:hypothetical protein
MSAAIDPTDPQDELPDLVVPPHPPDTRIRVRVSSWLVWHHRELTAITALLTGGVVVGGWVWWALAALTSTVWGIHEWGTSRHHQALRKGK